MKGVSSEYTLQCRLMMPQNGTENSEKKNLVFKRLMAKGNIKMQFPFLSFCPELFTIKCRQQRIITSVGTPTQVSEAAAPSDL